jgi:hypothetical protein
MKCGKEKEREERNLKKSTKKFKNGILVFLTIGMIMSSLPITHAQEQTKDNFSDGELVEKRELFSKQLQNEDGTITAVSYNYPIHYETSTGKMKDIDNTIISDISYQPLGLSKQVSKEQYYTSKDNPYIDVLFNKQTDSNNLIKINIDGYDISWGISNLNNSTATPLNDSETDSQYNLKNVTGGIKYTNAFENADLYYYITSANLKEEIILNEKSNINQIIYNIETSLTPFKTEHNLVIFQNENGENIFSFQNPYMYDNAEKSSMTFDTTVDIKKTENGYQLIYQLDTDWLNSEDRVYPIVIDPTVTNGRNQVNVLDTYVHPGDNVSHNHVNEDRLWIGNVYGTSRAFANWADLPTINGNINTAHISWNFFKGTSTWGPVSVYRVNSSWNSLNLTWDIHNTLSYTELASNIYPTLTNGYQGSSANVTNTIRGWYNGSVGKNGFMIRYTNESYNDYNTIVSSDSGSNSDFWPCLWINYNTDKPKAYTPTYYSDILDDIAISSSNTLNSWGYQTTFQRNPGQDDISNNITSQISILTGHGDTGHLFLGDRIISTGSSNEWVDGTQTPEHTTPKRRLKMGIKQWNLSTVDLMVFAACATAFENGAVTPLPKQAVESGVRTSVAWRQNIYSDSLQPFVNNLLVGLKNGKSVNDAVNYAKSFSYKDNRIYDVAIFGLANAKVSLPSSYTTKSMTIEKENDILKEYDVETLNSIEIGDIVDFIKSKINTSFDINDYIVERIDNIVRFVYAPSNIRTNNVYTAILNGNKVEKIYSHIEEDFESLDTIISAKQKLDVSIENQIKQDLLNDDTKQITIYQDGYKLENHELKYYVLYNINDNSLSYSDLYEQIIK